MKQPSVHILDLRGGVASFSLLKISQFFREMAAGDVLDVRGCDAETRSDLVKILPSGSYHLIYEAEAPDRCIRILKKTADESIHSHESNHQ
ncbi:MAG: hypothetical protein ACOC3W_05520 [Thermodesulfobacteriota bacterium]